MIPVDAQARLISSMTKASDRRSPPAAAECFGDGDPHKPHLAHPGHQVRGERFFAVQVRRAGGHLPLGEIARRIPDQTL